MFVGTDRMPPAPPAPAHTVARGAVGGGSRQAKKERVGHFSDLPPPPLLSLWRPFYLVGRRGRRGQGNKCPGGETACLPERRFHQRVLIDLRETEMTQQKNCNFILMSEESDIGNPLANPAPRLPLRGRQMKREREDDERRRDELDWTPSFRPWRTGLDSEEEEESVGSLFPLWSALFYPPFSLPFSLSSSSFFLAPFWHLSHASSSPSASLASRFVPRLTQKAEGKEEEAFQK